MKLRYSLLGWMVVLATALQAQDTAFTYQGRLHEAGQLAEGDYLLQFQLFGDESGDTAVGDPVIVGPVSVTGGLFTALVDLGSAVGQAEAAWLEIQVRTNGAAAPYQVLSPRQRLTAAPRAWLAQQAVSAEQADAVVSGAVTGESVEPGSLLATHLAADQVVTSLNGLRDDVVLEAGAQTAITAAGSALTIHSLGWGLQGNADTDPVTDFVGTADSAPLELRVNNRRVMRLEYHEARGLVNVIAGHPENQVTGGSFGVTVAGGGDGFGMAHLVEADAAVIGGGVNHHVGVNASYAVISGGLDNSVETWANESVIGGGSKNSIGENAMRSTIAGGYQNMIGPGGYFSALGGGWTNTILDYYGTIAGGVENHLGPGARYSSVGGGSSNRVDGSTTATIAGGAYHHIFDNSRRSTIGGGAFNWVQNFSPHATVGGGVGNVVGDNSEGAVIPGGVSNRVDGAYALAAGRLAHAAHPGALVWADSAPHAFASQANDEVALRAGGGVRMVTAVDGSGIATAGVTLPAGGGAWASLSDRSAKADFEPVDPAWVLEQVAQLPVEQWRYRAEADGVRHVGPMAQDFHRAFALGADDRTITTVDADGVALAAIQGLYRLVHEQQAEIRLLRAEVEALTTRRRSELPDAATSAGHAVAQTPAPRIP